MGSASSKFRKHLQSGDEVQALQLYTTNSELRKALDPNCSYGDSHQHETPLHLAAKHGMQTLLRIFLFSKGGNPNKTNARKETCLHCVCMETNSQCIHVCKRRAECLHHLLTWRGATLAEGQLERIDLAAQDDKMNTALHYAAASGLTQCVETLIQHGAPLFMENEDSLTPCDTAERNGHARIALYLESKMVFSNDEGPHDEEDSVSLPPVEEYSGLRPQDLQEAKDQLLVETADMLSVPLFTAEALLRNHEWSRETLLEAWMTDPVACCEKCGVTPPSTLFSEKPEVQENLASPLPSSLHTSLTPLDAECDICANTFLIADEPVHMTCTHQFCKECWERYLNVKIQEGDAHHITCPAYDCTMLVPVDVIEGIVSRDMALRYLQFDIKAFVDSNPDMKWCPYPGCGRAVKLPDLELGTGPGNKRSKIQTDTSRGVDCGVGHYFCWECLEESHEPCSCENWTKWFQKISEIQPENLDGTEQETELAANCLWLVTNSKSCPNCKSPIQKNEGCNHMKCSKCKYDFCWVCLEQWKRHNSSTGGYFKCNRYEALKKVEEHSAQLVSDAETKNKSMQELNRFVHYYTRFKNHENSYKFEEPLLKTAKDKMMKLAEAVTDNATAHAETKFVEDAVQQLLKARRVLKCSYVYGYYLDGPGYKKIVFEFMQTELEECTEILSQMVNRLYLRTPRRKIIEQAHIVQRKRLEFIMAISKGLVPPETPPSARKGKKKRKFSGEAEDEDLHRAIVASIQEVDPANPWIKDASGRHTNVVALLEWPSEESEESEGETETKTLRENIGKCHRAGCNKVRAKNPRTSEHHEYCSRWCMLVDKEDKSREEGEGLSEIVLDEHMELLRALEMSRLQYLRDSGLLHVPDSQDAHHSPVTKSTQTRAHRHKHRPRSNSAGQETKGKNKSCGLSSMEELGIELQRFQELSGAFPKGEREDLTSEGKKHSSKSAAHHRRKLSQSSRFDESKSTIVTRVPNKSVEDLYLLEQPPKSKLGQCHSQGLLSDTPTSLFDKPGATTALSADSLSTTGLSSTGEKVKNSSSSSLSTAAIAAGNSSSPSAKGLGLFSSMFGAIKDISVSNIHSKESDKTKEFLSKDLASIFAGWDTEEGKNTSSVQSEIPSSTVGSYARRPLTLEDCPASCGKGTSGKSTAGKSLVKGGKGKAKVSMSSVSVKENSMSAPQLGSQVQEEEDGGDESKKWLPCWSTLPLDETLVQEEKNNNSAVEQSQCNDLTRGVVSKTESTSTIELNKEECNVRDSGEISLLEMAENLLQMTADVHSRMREVEKGIRGLDIASDGERGQRPSSTRSTESLGSGAKKRNANDFEGKSMMDEKGDAGKWCESVGGNSAGDDDGKSGTDTLPASREKILFRLPKTAWSVDEEDAANTSTSLTSTPSLSHKTKTSSTTRPDSEGVRSKSSRKSSSKSKKSKAEPVALMCDTAGQVHEVRSGRTSKLDKLSSSSPKHISKINLRAWQEPQPMPTNPKQLQPHKISKTEGGETSCEDRTTTVSENRSSVEIQKADIPVTEAHLATCYHEYNQSNQSISEPLDDICFAVDADISPGTVTAMSNSPRQEAVSTRASSEHGNSGDSMSISDTIQYCLTRKIPSHALQESDIYPSSISQEAEGEFAGSGATPAPVLSRQSRSTRTSSSMDPICVGDDDNDNVIAISALVTDAYETATSDDNWEDAISVLPSDSWQSLKQNQNVEEEDDDDLNSVYV